MAVAIVDNAESIITSDGTTLTLTTPGDAASGHLLLAVIVIDGTPTDIAMSGWTAVSSETGTDGSTSVTIAVFRLQLVAAPAASYDCTWTNLETANGTIIAISGHNTTTPINTYADSNHAGALTFTPTGVTTTVDACLVLACVGLDRRAWSATPTTPDAALVAVSSPAGGNVSLGVAYQTQASYGATSHDSWDNASGDQYAAVVVAIAPASGAAVYGGIILMSDHFNGGVAL